MAQMVKNLPAMQETWVWSLDQEDLEKGMATHCWRATVHGVEKNQIQLSMESKRIRYN